LKATGAYKNVVLGVIECIIEITILLLNATSSTLWIIKTSL